jgi:hypothetical protein
MILRWKGLLLFAAVVRSFVGDGISSAEIHVSPTGNQNNPGTALAPVSTPSRALELIRAEPEGQPERRIVLHNGQYFDVAIVLTPADGGLVIEAAPGEHPVLFGGRRITGFQSDGGPLVAADIPTGRSADFRMLWVDGRLAHRARFPARGELKHLSQFKVPWMGTYGGGWQRKPTKEELRTMRVRPSDLGAQFDPLNAEITVFHEWDESTVGVKEYDPLSGLITFQSETGHPPGAFGNQGYVIWNTRDGLTEPGRWYLDRRRRRIVYWPLAGEDISNLEVIVPTTTALFRIEGTRQKPVRDLTLRGLTLAVANTPLMAGGFGAYAFDGAITAEHVRDCTFSNLRIGQVAGQGIKISDAQNCRIQKNEVKEAGAGGVICIGADSSEISWNHICQVGQIYPSAIGESCGGRNNRLSGNFIHDAPYVGLTCDGIGALIESNRIERVMLELHDGAGIYLGGTNHLIRANLCRSIGDSPTDRRHAYYMDEMVRHCRLEGNLAVQCPSPLHNHLASDNEIVNNVFVEDGDLRLAFYRCENYRLLGNLVLAKGKIEVFRPEAVQIWKDNLFVSEEGSVLAFSVAEYSPGLPRPLRVNGIHVSTRPEVEAIWADRIAWPIESLPGRFGIQPLDLSRAGRNAGPQEISGMGTR